MTIDRRMYEKYSGRTGDPRTRLGEALAQNVAKKQRDRDQLERTRLWVRVFTILRFLRW